MTAHASLLNGNIGETESLLRAILATMDDHFTREAKNVTSTGKKIETEYSDGLKKMGEVLQSILGFLVVVPSNPENAYFQIVEGILNFLKKEEWGTSQLAYRIHLKVLDSCVRYLASQLQDELPYRIPYVESNDQIFIGNDDFTQEAEGLMDHCFELIMETIQKLDETKEQYYPVLFDACLDSANILIGNCEIQGKVNGYINKMFKMSDKYLVEHNKLKGNDTELNRNYINSSYEAFRKKKEA